MRDAMIGRRCVLAGVVWAWAFILSCASLVADEGNNLLQRLVGDGISLTETTNASIDRPTFLDADGKPVGDAEVEQALKQVARAGGVARFVRDSVVAPVAIEMDSVRDDAGQRIGHVLNVTFVVHAALDVVRDSDALDQLMGLQEPAAEDAGEAKTLSEDELTKAGVASAMDDETSDDETYGRVRFPLLDRVLIQGVIHAESFRRIEGNEQDRVTIAWQLDPRFENTWSPIKRDDLGQEVIGDAKAYQGIGGVIVATRLPPAIAPSGKDATVVQARLVIHEPEAWFGGRNQLRSKLPLLIQDRVRDLRKKLAEAD
ncbi:hypothetical protein [Rhodopirellula halodulae]|uniref:hypothetical protein n=1 Tax=Rhodopirellula halodulae TaxID=2894198 RepID=UPI001E5AF6D6|nr:hypothetical protein [Rhodopirellula sp. JC737]MCC9655394.1 hypothetical protein [Rhodopirellula sp. JC737]